MSRFTQSIKHSLEPFSKPRTIAYAAMLIALNVVFTRLLSIQTQFLRIDFGFLPVAVFSMLFGPIPGAVAAAIGDVIGFFLFPPPGGAPYFPGFTLSAFILGLIFGTFLYKKELTIQKIIAACFFAVFVVDLCLNTFWLSVMYDQAIRFLIIWRIIKSAIMVAIEILIIFYFEKYLGQRLRAQLNLNR